MSDKIKIYNKPDLKNTISSHRNDIDLPNVPNVNKRHEQIKFKDEDIKGPSVSLEENTDALLTYFRDTIAPYVTIDTNEKIKVPVVWMGREKWTEVSELGHIRDTKGKLQCPVIAIRKTSIQAREELRKANVLRESSNMWTVYQKYSKTEIYDKFSLLNNSERKPNLYKIMFPDYIYINYNIYIWTDTESQLDEIIGKLISYNHLAFGDKNYYKFTTKFDNFVIDTTNNPSSERKINSTCNLTLDGYIIQDEYWYNNNLTKFIQPETIVTTNV